MKKLFLALAVLAFCSVPVLAQEAQQTQEANQVYGAIVVKKQPTQEGVIQSQKVEKVYGSIVIFVQGKTPWDKTEKKEAENK